MTRWAQVSDAELDERLAAELRVAAGNGDADQWTRDELLPTIRARMSAARERRSPRLSLAQFAGLGAALGLSAVLALVVLTRLPGSRPGGPHGEAHAGDFVLTIMTDEPFYTPGQPIGVQAGFLYQGPDQQVVVSTSHPITMFHVRQLDGPLEMTGDAPAVCMRYELERHEQLTHQFTKIGGWSRSDPNAAFYETWWSAPDLWLPAGRWQISAYSDFNLGADCAGERLTMEAAIEVLVREGSEPSPSASPSVSDAAVVPLPTHEPGGPNDPGACPTSLAYGELVAHADWGIALEVGTIKRIQRVLWPHGFVGRWREGRLALTDGSGNAVAHVGDIVGLGGGNVSDDTWLACGELEVLPPPSPSPATPTPSLFEQFGRLVETDRTVNVHVAPDEGGTVQDTLDAWLVYATESRAVDGETWYRVEYRLHRREMVFGWIRGNVNLARAERVCPRDTSFPSLAGLLPAEFLECYREQELVIGPVMIIEVVDPVVVRGEPQWLAERAQYGLVINRQNPHAMIEVHIPPELRVAEFIGTWVSVTARVDDPRSAGCARDAGAAGLSPETSAEQELWCRQQLVAVDISVAAAPTAAPSDQPNKGQE